jgi:hypothetical protein
MKTFIIFDRQSGEILQTHVQAEDLRGSHHDLLSAVRPGATTEAVDVIQAESLAPGGAYRVDVKTRKLVHAEGGAPRGAGGAFLQPVGGDPRSARTVVVHVKERHRP